MLTGIDFGPNPVRTPPTASERMQIRMVLGIGSPGQRVAFPAANDSAGLPGQFAVGEAAGVSWIAVYTGDGITHSWVFAPAQTTYPTT